MVGATQPSKPYGRLKIMSRIVAIALMVTALGTAWPG
jgi:hypothetical protein